MFGQVGNRVANRYVCQCSIVVSACSCNKYHCFNHIVRAAQVYIGRLSGVFEPSGFPFAIQAVTRASLQDTCGNEPPADIVVNQLTFSGIYGNGIYFLVPVEYPDIIIYLHSRPYQFFRLDRPFYHCRGCNLHPDVPNCRNTVVIHGFSGLEQFIYDILYIPNVFQLTPESGRYQLAGSISSIADYATAEHYYKCK